jgi:hypothetical protein
VITTAEQRHVGRRIWTDAPLQSRRSGELDGDGGGVPGQVQTDSCRSALWRSAGGVPGPAKREWGDHGDGVDTGAAQRLHAFSQRVTARRARGYYRLHTPGTPASGSATRAEPWPSGVIHARSRTVATSEVARRAGVPPMSRWLPAFRLAWQVLVGGSARTPVGHGMVGDLTGCAAARRSRVIYGGSAGRGRDRPGPPHSQLGDRVGARKYDPFDEELVFIPPPRAEFSRLTPDRQPRHSRADRREPGRITDR